MEVICAKQPARRSDRRLQYAGLNAAQAVEIEYWQYVFDTRVKAMDRADQASSRPPIPDITVKQTTFPYADYQTTVVAAMPAGQGPDVVQLFYGWLDKFVAGKLLQPLPTDAFPHDKIEKRVLPDRHGDEARRRLLRPADRRALAGAVLQQEAVPGGRARSRTSRRRRSTSSSPPPRRPPSATAAATSSSAGIDPRHGAARTTNGGARCWSASSAACPIRTTTAR